jgi:hypothetical protein
MFPPDAKINRQLIAAVDLSDGMARPGFDAKMESEV